MRGLRNPKSRAYNSVAETCPAVDAAFSELQDGLEACTVDDFARGSHTILIDACIERVKEQTTLLRDGIISAYTEMEESLEEQERNFQYQIEILKENYE